MPRSKKSLSETKEIGLFDILGSVNEGSSTPSLMIGCYAHEEALDKSSITQKYVAFMINRGLSYFQDTCILANEMNRNHHLPPKMQYDFLKGIVRPRKRFSKWFKKDAASEGVSLLMKAYGYSEEKARSVVSFVPESELNRLRTKFEIGGSKGK